MSIVQSASPKPIPGPRGVPILGVVPEMARDMLGLFTTTSRTYGGIAQLKVLNKTYLLITDPKHVKYILQDNYRNYIRGASVERGRLLLGNGLPLIDGDFWLKERRLMQPAFHRHRLEKLTGSMIGMIAPFLARWQTFAQTGTPLDIHAEMIRLTLSVIVKAMFGEDISPQLEPLAKSFDVAAHFMLIRSQSAWPLPLWVPTPRHMAYKNAVRTLNEIIYPIIQRARREPRDDLLGLLLTMRDEETGEGMSDQQARDEVVTIFFAGHETTATALTWAFYLLSQHPEIEARVRDEITTVLGSRSPAFADLPNLPYLHRVLQETLRLYPSAYLFAREAVEDDVIDGYRIPAGKLIFICPFITHHDPAYWPDPERFDPDRFLPEQVAARPREVYYPFGEGPHVCIGNHLAMMEMQLILAMALQKYTWQLVPHHPVAIQPVVSLTPKYGMKMNLQAR
ncbi:MAG: cytochrome P450 [Anaerolineales bacterium]